MRPKEELVIVTKTYDLILWSCQHTSRFPRNHRFVLGERIERNLYDLLETLIQAKYQRERAALLEAANLSVARAGRFWAGKYNAEVAAILPFSCPRFSCHPL